MKVSQLVTEQNLGVVLPSFYEIDYDWFYKVLVEKKNTFSFDADMADKHSWNYIEHKLVNAHQKKYSEINKAS